MAMKIEVLQTSFILVIIALVCGLSSATSDPCFEVDCGKDYACAENKAAINGYECRYAPSNDDSKNTSVTACLCENGGVCKYDTLNQTNSCICKSPYVGLYCQINTETILSETSLANQKPNEVKFHNLNNVQFNPVDDICKIYNSLNINLCKNGGYCLSVFAGKAHCVCPITTKGDYCEELVYLHCPSALQLCHKDHGTCVNGNSCVCKEGYRGERCDEQDICESTYCLNGGTCNQNATAPFRFCACTDTYRGKRCENQIPATVATTTQGPRCNYTIVLRNEGGYVARIKVVHTLNDIRQPAITSNVVKVLEKTNPIVLLSSARNIIVRIEYFRIDKWILIHEDRNLGIERECLKCFKTWGTIIKPRWDYLFC